MAVAPDDTVEEEPAGPPLEVLAEPRDGIPAVVSEADALREVTGALARGTGPLAVDTERASGYRYGQRAYLVQLRREGAGTVLIDPVALPDLAPLGEALRDVEWVLHAATQDLPSLAETGMRPAALFDTELGARLAGLPRVGLAAVTEHYLGVTLAKEHSAVDWSQRPLPEDWLRYAALDVELLAQLRDRLAEDLEQQGKLAWARQEFAALAAFEPPSRADPWRRVSGMHKVRNRRATAAVRELWHARDRIAREKDVAPGRVLPDATLIDLAVRAPLTAAQLTAAGAVESGHARARRAQQGLQRHQHHWLEAIREATALPEGQLPEATRPAEGPPPARAWADRDPVAAARLARVREELAALSQRVAVPVENILTPESLRRVLWQPPGPGDEESVDAALATLGARPWQRELVVPLVVAALAEHPRD